MAKLMKLTHGKLGTEDEPRWRLVDFGEDLEAFGRKMKDHGLRSVVTEKDGTHRIVQDSRASPFVMLDKHGRPVRHTPKPDRLEVAGEDPHADYPLIPPETWRQDIH